MEQSNSEAGRLELASPKQKRWWLLLIALSAIILRSPAYFNPIIDEDEAVYATAARVMNSGGLLYQDAVELKPPLLIYFYALLFSILGDDLRVLHGVTVLWTLATAAFIGQITNHLSKKWEAAYLSAWLYVLFTPTFVPQALSTNGEILMNLPLAISVFSFLKFDRRWGGAYLVLSGFCCGLAFLFKYQSGILLAAMVGYILVAKPWLAKRWPDKSAYKQCLLVIGGFAGVLILLYGIFRYHGNWEDFYFWGWKYNFTFLGGLTWPFFFRRLFGMTPRFIFAWLILWIFAFAAIKRALRFSRHGEHLIILWLAGSALAVCAGGKFFGHYYIQLLPPAAILAGRAMVEWWQESHAIKFAKWKRSLVVAGIAFPALLYLGVNWQEELKRDRLVNQPIRTISAEVQKLSSDQDKIFIWGRMPELHYFSRRPPASRFVTFLVWMNMYDYSKKNPRLGSEAFSPLWDLLLADLTSTRPKLIIDTAPPNFRYFGNYPISEFPRLQDFVIKNYRLVRTIERLAIYEAKF